MGSAFSRSISATAKRFFESYKFRVVSRSAWGLERDMGRILPTLSTDWRETLTWNGEGVPARNGHQHADVVEMLERDLRPVVTTNRPFFEGPEPGGVRACIPHAGSLLLAGDR
jgi:hypothetical protein